MCLSPIECILPIGIYPSIFAAVADAVGAKNSNGFFTFLTIFTSLSRHSFMREREKRIPRFLIILLLTFMYLLPFFICSFPHFTSAKWNCKILVLLKNLLKCEKMYVIALANEIPLMRKLFYWMCDCVLSILFKYLKLTWDNALKEKNKN